MRDTRTSEMYRYNSKNKEFHKKRCLQRKSYIQSLGERIIHNQYHGNGINMSLSRLKFNLNPIQLHLWKTSKKS